MTAGRDATKQLTSMGVADARAGLASGQFTSVDLTQALLRRIERVDGALHAFLRTTPTMALEAAAEADHARADGDYRPLLGVPLAIKDVLMTNGIETTAGSRILKGFVPPYSATAVQKIGGGRRDCIGQNQHR